VRPDLRRAAVDTGREAPSADPRETALRILIAVEVRGAFSDKLLEQAHGTLSDPRDQALLHELVKGTLRWRGRLDAVLDRIVHIGIAGTQPHVRNVLRLGAYQILFLDRIPAHAAVDESVKLAHKVSHAGAAGLVNSVLRRLVEEKETLVPPAGDDAASLAVWGSHPEWLVTRWLARFGPEATRALMLANNTPARLGLRVNALRANRETLIARLESEGVVATPSERVPELVWVEGGVAPAALAAFRDGVCTAQDESEALVSRLVAPEPHERILDLCAAPGGKCTHLAELIRDEGEVWAMERAPERIASLEQTVTRLGCQSVHVVPGDGRTYTFPMPFDRVLVDAPCSSLGVIGRRADARWRKGPETLLEMPAVQLELLIAGARRVRPGGVLVYSVCSFEPEETTAVVERFLAAEPGFTVEPAGAWLPADVVDDRGFMCVLPHRHGCDGAFAARFRRS
jgi:16S rRNA (cytosine967-C5)-methyltransferase